MVEEPATGGEPKEMKIKGSPTVEIKDVTNRPRIGVLRDSAFQFYYPENIDALSDEDAEVVFVSPLKDRKLLDLDALYIGGGFPETHARELAESKAYRDKIKVLAEAGTPIYAECGGLMYLGKSLLLNGKTYPMVNVFPMTFDFHKKPQGHGYTILDVETENPFFPVGMRIKGHEFHYSKAIAFPEDMGHFAFAVQRGVGLLDRRDGICFKNVLATYTHIHALGTTTWAGALIEKARSFRNKSNKSIPS